MTGSRRSRMRTARPSTLSPRRPIEIVPSGWRKSSATASQVGERSPREEGDDEETDSRRGTRAPKPGRGCRPGEGQGADRRGAGGPGPVRQPREGGAPPAGGGRGPPRAARGAGGRRGGAG